MTRALKIAVFLLVPLLPSFSRAARLSVTPLIVSLSHGYGVVQIAVVSATPAEREGQFNVCCKVQKILAFPVAGGSLELKEGDEISVPLGVGYGEVIEGFRIGDGHPFRDSVHPLDPGTQYDLTLKYEPPQVTCRISAPTPPVITMSQTLILRIP